MDTWKGDGASTRPSQPWPLCPCTHLQGDSSAASSPQGPDPSCGALALGGVGFHWRNGQCLWGSEQVSVKTCSLQEPGFPGFGFGTCGSSHRLCFLNCKQFTKCLPWFPLSLRLTLCKIYDSAVSSHVFPFPFLFLFFLFFQGLCAELDSQPYFYSETESC